MLVAESCRTFHKSCVAAAWWDGWSRQGSCPPDDGCVPQALPAPHLLTAEPAQQIDPLGSSFQPMEHLPFVAECSRLCLYRTAECDSVTMATSAFLCCFMCNLPHEADTAPVMTLNCTASEVTCKCIVNSLKCGKPRKTRSRQDRPVTDLSQRLERAYLITDLPACRMRGRLSDYE